MSELFMSLAVFALLFAVSTATLCLASYFFPSLKNHFPDGWEKWMSFRFVTYYFLVASVFLFLGAN